MFFLILARYKQPRVDIILDITLWMLVIISLGQILGERNAEPVSTQYAFQKLMPRFNATNK